MSPGVILSGKYALSIEAKAVLEKIIIRLNTINNFLKLFKLIPPICLVCFNRIILKVILVNCLLKCMQKNISFKTT